MCTKTKKMLMMNWNNEKSRRKLYYWMMWNNANWLQSMTALSYCNLRYMVFAKNTRKRSSNKTTLVCTSVWNCSFRWSLSYLLSHS